MQVSKKLPVFVNIFVFTVIFSLSLACGGGGGGGGEDEDEVLIIPSIELDYEKRVPVGFTATIDASASSSNNGNPIFFEWTLVRKPAGSNLDVANLINSTIEIFIDKIGKYEVKLKVFEGNSLSRTETILFDGVNSAPAIDVAFSQKRVTIGDTLTLNASGSTDNDNHILSYSWSLSEKPSESLVDINSQSSLEEISLTLDIVGYYEIELIVSDSYQQTSSLISLDVTDDMSEYSLYFLDFWPKYTRYNSITNKLYMLASEQPYLYIFDTNTRTLDKINLPDTAWSFTFSKDETKAVVSVHSNIVIIDLLDEEILNSFNVGMPMGHAVYLESQISLFPQSAHFNPAIVQIGFSTETAVIPKVTNEIGGPPVGNAVREGAYPKYNIFNNDVYVKAGNSGSFERFVVGDGKMEASYRLPNAAGSEETSGWVNPIGNDFWIMNDENILTSNGNLLNSGFTGREVEQSEVLIRRLDLGENYWKSFISSASHSTLSNKLLITISPFESDIDDSKIYEFNFGTFEQEKAYQLPTLFGKDGVEWPIYGYQVFHGTEDVNHIALSYVSTQSGLENPWVIAVHENGELVRNKKPIINSYHEKFLNTGENSNIVLDSKVFSHLDGSISYELTKPEMSQATLFKNDSGSYSINPDTKGIFEIVFESVNEFGGALKSFLFLRAQEPYTVNAISIGGSPEDSLYDPNNNNLFVATTNNRLLKIDGNSLATNEVHIDDEIYSIQMSPNGEFLVVSAGYSLYIYDAKTLEIVRSFNIGYVALDMTFVSDQRFVVSTENYGPFNFDYSSLLIDLNEGLVYEQNIMSDMYCKLQESNQRLLCLWNTSKAGEFFNYVVTSDGIEEVAVEITSHNYHDSQFYPNGTDIEISPDQKFVLSEGGYIFNLSETYGDSNDLTYFNSLDSYFRILGQQDTAWSQSGEYIYRVSQSINLFAPNNHKFIERINSETMGLDENIRIPNSLKESELLGRTIHSGENDNEFFLIACENDSNSSTVGDGYCELMKFVK